MITLGRLTSKSPAWAREPFHEEVVGNVWRLLWLAACTDWIHRGRVVRLPRLRGRQRGARICLVSVHAARRRLWGRRGCGAAAAVGPPRLWGRRGWLDT
jgi:hypothetical protein